jgi:hypothetical protein
MKASSQLHAPAALYPWAPDAAWKNRSLPLSESNLGRPACGVFDLLQEATVQTPASDLYMSQHFPITVSKILQFMLLPQRKELLFTFVGKSCTIVLYILILNFFKLT